MKPLGSRRKQRSSREAALGRAGCFPARRRRQQRRIRLRRRREDHSGQHQTVGSGTTGHAESARVTFDPRKVSYGRLYNLLFGRSRSDPIEPARTGQRHAVSIRHFSD